MVVFRLERDGNVNDNHAHLHLVVILRPSLLTVRRRGAITNENVAGFSKYFLPAPALIKTIKTSKKSNIVRSRTDCSSTKNRVEKNPKNFFILKVAFRARSR